MARRLLLAFVATVICLLLAEGLVRIFAGEILPDPGGPRYLFQADPVLGVVHRPDFRGRFQFHGEFDVPIEINSIGFRDRAIGAKPANTTRILSLGDSFAFGFGVNADETYAKVLEGNLNEGAPPRRFEVINAGVSGYGTRQMLDLLKRHIGALDPDIVLAALFFANDLTDNVGELKTERGGIVLTQHFARQVDGSLFLRFSFHCSYLGLLATRAWFNYAHNAGLGEEVDLGKYWGLDYLRRSPAPGLARELDRQWSVVTDLLTQMQQECSKHGARLVLVNIPLEYQTRSHLWAKIVREHGDVSNDTHDVDLVSKRLRTICTRLSIPFLDLVEGFRAEKPESTRFFPINRHFNAAGNRHAAQLIGAFLRQKIL